MRDWDRGLRASTSTTQWSTTRTRGPPVLIRARGGNGSRGGERSAPSSCCRVMLQACRCDRGRPSAPILPNPSAMARQRVWRSRPAGLSAGRGRSGGLGESGIDFAYRLRFRIHEMECFAVMAGPHASIRRGRRPHNRRAPRWLRRGWGSGRGVLQVISRVAPVLGTSSTDRRSCPSRR